MVVPTSSPHCRHYTHPVSVDGVQHRTWRRLEGVEGSREDPDGRNGKMSERNFPHVPISPSAVSAWGFTMKMVQKRSPIEGGE